MKAMRVTILASLFLAGTAAAEVIIYKQPRFGGEALSLRGDLNNLGDRGFLDQASSIVVKSGQWQFCTQPDFKGDCVTLERGEYPTLDQRLNHRVESVREMTRYAGNDRGDARRASSRGAAVEVFTEPDFRGRSARISRDVESLDQDASSVVIYEGSWQLCSRPAYEGSCRVYQPGEYETLGRRNRGIASMRRVG